MTEQRPSDPTRGKTILLVEDHADARDALARTLELEGYEVQQAENGITAVDMAARLKPDVVIADLLMPRMDGVELARVLRAAHGPSLRLIALTGLSPQKTLAASKDAGFDFYLVKPVTARQLIPYIENELYKGD